ncbi:RNA-dependent RNA polymerase family protein [Aquibium oceanicum]|uniref:Reverse transcriptase domain-containing protein n=1 Tax=Aquibium oceanicum TaxID=1670800 RepID=A0A1L3STZ9_9HYPH|nr:hypothetical protein [Aquibium oceanicum]APH72864.1 hypothetical protein BSQ44_16930 [Aquibium oceanicum]
MTTSQPSADAEHALVGNPKSWRPISPSAYRRGKKELERFQRRQQTALAEGRTRDAKKIGRLIERSWDVRRYIAIEECRRYNRRALAQRGNEDEPKPQPDFVAPDWCNALHRDQIAAFDRLAQDHEEELRRGEIVIERDIVLVGDGAPGRGAMRRKKATDALALAERLNPRNAPLITVPTHQERHDRYTVFPVPKGKTFRPMHAFGMFDRVRQKLLSHAYGGVLATSQSSYSGKGRGGHRAAVDRVAEIMTDPAIRCVGILDLENFYPSIEREWVKTNLPVPPRHITSTALLEDRNEPFGELMADLTGMARTRARLKGVGHGQHGLSYIYAYYLQLTSLAGLPQGAATSTAIANHVIATILKDVELPAGIDIVNVADDFAVLGPSYAAVDAAIENLRETFASHPSGRFVMHRSSTQTLAAGFEFLGMKFRRKKDIVTVEPDDGCKRRGRLRILNAVLSVAEGKTESSHLRKAVAATTAAFGDWRAKHNWVWRLVHDLTARSPSFQNDIADVLGDLRTAATEELTVFCQGGETAGVNQVQS